MKQAFSLIAVLPLVSGIVSAAEPEMKVRARQMVFHIRVLEGDPLGSPEAGTIKVLSTPTLVTTENLPFNTFTGGEIPLNAGGDGKQFVETGLRIKGTPGKVERDRFILDFTLTETRLDDSVKQSETRQQFTTVGTRVISTLKLGDVVRYRISQTPSVNGEERWVELTPELVTPIFEN